MLPRQKSGAVVCPSCGRLVSVSEPKCPYCGRVRPGMFGFLGFFQKIGRDAAFPSIAIGLCAALYGLSLLFDVAGIRQGGMLGFLSPSGEALLAFGASGAWPTFGLGHWWTLLSAGWLHGSLLHLVFNMMWLRDLGPEVANLYGASRMIVIYTVASIVGFAASSGMGRLFPGVPFLGGAGVTVGASAAIFGLLGALVAYSRRGGSRNLGKQAWTWAIGLFVVGLIMPHVDNWAHLGGFFGGFLTSKLLDPLKEERADHTVLALVCLLATVGSIVVSLWMSRAL